MPIYHVTAATSASLVLSTEHAGAAACRAGVARSENPYRSAPDATGLPIDERTRRDLVDAWFRGWDRERVAALCTSGR